MIKLTRKEQIKRYKFKLDLIKFYFIRTTMNIEGQLTVYLSTNLPRIVDIKKPNIDDISQ